MCFVFIWEQTPTCATYINKFLVLKFKITRNWKLVSTNHIFHKVDKKPDFNLYFSMFYQLLCFCVKIFMNSMLRRPRGFGQTTWLTRTPVSCHTASRIARRTIWYAEFHFMFRTSLPLFSWLRLGRILLTFYSSHRAAIPYCNEYYHN